MKLHLRRLAALAVLVTYAWPLTLGALADLSHGVHHVADTLREREARAAAFGVGHLGDEARFSHSHGGEVHSHSGPVDALLAASDGAGNEPDESLVPIVVLSMHAPTTVVHFVAAPPSVRVAVATYAAAAEHSRSAPPLPPPRA
jgi:hypothetical protein